MTGIQLSPTAQFNFSQVNWTTMFNTPARE
jgi:hypothetical protein